MALLCLCSASVGLFGRLLACVLAAHTLVISAYLVHDAAHNTLCASEANNTRLGEACLWLCGGAAASFARVRHMHVRHHRDRQDTGACLTLFICKGMRNRSTSHASLEQEFGFPTLHF